MRLLDDTLSCPSNLRDFSWHYLHRLADTEVERWRDQPGPLKAVDISPDQTLFAAGGLSRSVQVWKRGRKRPVAVLSDHDGWVSSLCFSHDGRLLATASQQTVTVWNVSTSQIVRRIEHGGEVDCVGYTGDGKLLISAGNGIAVWDAATGNLVRRLADESRRIHHMVLATTSQRMLTAQHNGVLELWELDQSKPPRTIATPGCPITCLDMSKDETRFLFNDRFVVHVHNLADGEEICQLRQADETRLGEWRTARFSPDGQMIAAGGGGDPIKLWDAETGLARLVLTPRLGSVDAMQFTSNGSSLVTGDHAGAVTLWRISPHDGNRVTELSGSRLAVSPNGRFVAATDQLQVAVLETSKGSVISSLKVAGVINLRFSPSSGLLAGLLEGGEIRLWNPASGREVARKKNETRGEALAFIDDDSLAFSSGDSGIAVWDLPDGDMYQLDGGGQAVLCLAVAPDGHQLAAGHGIHPLPDKTPPGKVVVWNLETKRQLATLKGHSSFGVYGVDFSSDGKMLASCGDGLLLWETRNYQQLNAITGHTAPIWSVSFSPDGRTIATASMDTTVRLWDPQSGEQRLSLVGHTGWVTAVGFAPNSRNLYSAGFDRKVRSWPGDEHLLGAGAKP